MKRIGLFVISLFVSSAAFAVQPFELRVMNGETVNETFNSDTYPDGVFVIEAYFNNCPYCHQNAPKINSLAKKFEGEESVHVLDVSRDCRQSDYTRWMQRTNPNHSVLNDCNQAVLGQLAIRGFPTTIVLDCNLTEVYRHVGAMTSSDYTTLVAKVEQVVAAGCQR